MEFDKCNNWIIYKMSQFVLRNEFVLINYFWLGTFGRLTVKYDSVIEQANIAKVISADMNNQTLLFEMFLTKYTTYVLPLKRHTTYDLFLTLFDTYYFYKASLHCIY
jgi:hypothetical protein